MLVLTGQLKELDVDSRLDDQPAVVDCLYKEVQ